MRAITNDRYGTPDVLELREVDRPTPKPDEVLVRVHATPINSGDMHLLCGELFCVRLYWGLIRPRRKVLGWGLSGVVEAVGSNVTDFAPGDEVFGEAPNGGTWAEYVAVPAQKLARKPASLSHVEAASVPVGAITALQAVRDKGGVRPGDKVLIHGASGGVGLFAVQLAKHFGATVTGTASAAKLDHVRALGADQALDYRSSDFTTLPERYDVIVDLVGDKPLGACKRALTPDGRYVCLAGHPWRTFRAAIFGGKRVVVMLADANRADLDFLRELVDAGTLRTVIDRTYTLPELPDAMRYYLGGAARGKVVVTV
ncbi:MAG: NAD(P)-dependent alcohol dehydrogenase [Myxococcales bacterium]|nr:NAD(P)-dependent alcohol dehydrogenase [Myxococcales bacterium]